MVYRVEVSPNNRAICKATTCGKAKIEKGELRLGTWVKGPNFESWSWRHWGCFTPQQIVNARKPLIPEGEEDEEGMEVDMKLFDGWEELSDEQKDKVRVAVEVGHVDDEDWRGDVGLNRKGAKKARGKSTPAAKKGKKKKDDEEEEEEAVETDEEPAPKKSTKKTSTASTTTASKKRTPAKKSTPTPTPSPSASPEPVKPQKSATSKRAAKPVAEPTRPRSSRATAATPKKYTEVNESADEDSPPVARKLRTPGRNAKPAKDGKSARKRRGKKAGGDSDTEGEDAEMALHADEGAGEDTVDPPVPKPQSKGRDGGRKRGAAAVVDDVQGEIDEEEEQPKKKRTKAKPTPTKKEQSVKTKKATTTPASDKKTKTKAKDSAKETSEAKDKGELGKSIFGGE